MTISSSRGRIELEVLHGLGAEFRQHRHQVATAHRRIAERQHAVQHHLDCEAHDVRVTRPEPVGKLLDASDVRGAQAQRDCLFTSFSQCSILPTLPSVGSTARMLRGVNLTTATIRRPGTQPVNRFTAPLERRVAVRLQG